MLRKQVRERLLASAQLVPDALHEHGPHCFKHVVYKPRYLQLSVDTYLVDSHDRLVNLLSLISGNYKVACVQSDYCFRQHLHCHVFLVLRVDQRPEVQSVEVPTFNQLG